MDALRWAAEIGLFAFALRATLLLGAAVAIAWGLRSYAAATRHLLWTTTFITLLALPLGLALLPAWELPILPSAPAEKAEPFIESALVEGFATERAPEQSALPGRLQRLEHARSVVVTRSVLERLPSVRAMALSVWLLGSIASLVALLVSLRRFFTLVANSTVIEDPAWRGPMEMLCLRLGIRRRVTLRCSPQVPTPMTGGVWRPTVLLPDAAHAWSSERRAVVLAHELVHVRRADALRQILGRLALTVYWFHPLSWVAARLAALSREQACDEEVVALGTRPSDYASHLLDLAATMGPAPAVLTIPMVQHSNLERRLMDILKPSRPRRSALLAIGVLALVAAVGLSAAIAHPVSPTTQQAVAPKPAPAAEPNVVVKPVIAVAVAPAPAANPAPALALAAGARPQEPTCAYNGSHNFSGTLTTRGDRDTDRYYEQSGWSDGDRIIQRFVDGVRLCMRQHGEVMLTDDGNGLRELGSGGWVLLEAEDAGLQRMLISGGASGIEHEWSVDGGQRPFDAEALSWRDSMMEVLNGSWQASRLRGQQSSLKGQISSARGQVSSMKGQISSARGQVSSMRGQISSARGQVSSMKGQISSARGQVSSMRGQISSARGHVSSLKGQISSARGQVSSMRGRISSHRGELSGLRAAINATGNEETRASLRAEIAEQQDEIAEVEARIMAYDLDARVLEIQEKIEAYDLDARVLEFEEQIEDYDLDARVLEFEEQIEDFELDGKVLEFKEQIEDFDLDGKVLEFEQQIEDFDLDGKVLEFEQQIEELDADRRAEEIERALEPQLRELRQLIERQ